MTGICVKLVSGKIPGLKFLKNNLKGDHRGSCLCSYRNYDWVCHLIYHSPKASSWFLRIDKSDPDGPYLFLELKKSVNEIIAQRTVLLEVKREDFISHK